MLPVFAGGIRLALVALALKLMIARALGLVAGVLGRPTHSASNKPVISQTGKYPAIGWFGFHKALVMVTIMLAIAKVFWRSPEPLRWLCPERLRPPAGLFSWMASLLGYGVSSCAL